MQSCEEMNESHRYSFKIQISRFDASSWPQRISLSQKLLSDLTATGD